MAWTLKNYQDRVIALVADQSPSAEDILVWVNEAKARMQPYAQVPGSTTVTLVSGTRDYATPADMYEPASVYYYDTEDEVVTYPIVGELDKSSNGVRFWNDRMYVRPKPDAESDGRVLTVEYWKTISDLASDSDTFTFGAEWHDIPFLFACMRAKEQDSEFGEGQDFAGQYTSRMREFIAHTNAGSSSGFQTEIVW